MVKKKKTKKHKTVVADLSALRKQAAAKGFDESVLKNLKAGELDIKNATIDNLKVQLALIYSMLKVAEKNYHKYPTDRNCYAVAKLIETASYLLTAIDEKREADEVASRFMESIVHPLLKDVVAVTSDKLRDMRDKLHNMKSKKDINPICEMFLREFGESVENIYSDYADRVLNIVKEEM